MSAERVPGELRARIAHDLRPVRPLPAPLWRALSLLPLGLLVWWLLYARGLRVDADRIGGLILWGLSWVQAGAGILLLTIALREAVPGRTARPRWLLLVGLAVPVWLAGVTWLTWLRSPSGLPAGQEAFYWRWCTGWSVVAALPLLAAALLLARRAFPMRPVLIGALCGLGAGLIVDGGWRTYCEVSQPGHVLDAHMLALAVTTAAGALLGRLLARRPG